MDAIDDELRNAVKEAHSRESMRQIDSTVSDLQKTYGFDSESYFEIMQDFQNSIDQSLKTLVLQRLDLFQLALRSIGITSEAKEILLFKETLERYVLTRLNQENSSMDSAEGIGHA